MLDDADPQELLRRLIYLEQSHLALREIVSRLTVRLLLSETPEAAAEFLDLIERPYGAVLTPIASVKQQKDYLVEVNVALARFGEVTRAALVAARRGQGQGG
jgi:hypothetical protein